MTVLMMLLVITIIVIAAASSNNNNIPLSNSKNGFQANIQRSHGHLIKKTELLRIAAKQDKARIMKIMVDAKKGGVRRIEPHIKQSSGEFFINLSIGTPKPSQFSAVIDTGSDLIWTKCRKHNCFNKSTPPVFDPTKSSSYAELKCDSDMCKALPSNRSSCGKQYGECMYTYKYGDNTSTSGVLAAETFTFEGNISVQKLGFGCGFDNQGLNIEQIGGIVGLGRGNLSLVSQMKYPMFSYCLPTFGSNETGLLSVGFLADTLRGAKTTPLINNPFDSTLYYLSLQGITIGDTRLKINKTKLELQRDGTGGLIIDSGTSLTYLEKSVFGQVTKVLTKQLNLPLFNASGTDIALELCYNITRAIEDIPFPNITFHFMGGAHFEVIPENYLALADDTTLCLMMGSSFFANGFSIFGNFQQQNALVGYDLSKNKLSFIADTKCATAS